MLDLVVAPQALLRALLLVHGSTSIAQGAAAGAWLHKLHQQFDSGAKHGQLPQHLLNMPTRYDCQSGVQPKPS